VFSLDNAFAVFDHQDSGCLSYGVESDGRRWFVKRARTAAGRASLLRALDLHAAVRHDAIVRPVQVLDGPVLVYPWYDGTVLNAATLAGTNRSALYRFQALPVPEVLDALDTVLDAHLAVASAGFVPIDLYDGCFLYDFDHHVMRLIDLDEYRPGPFVLDTERLPGSRAYMAPEEFVRGSTIDVRTGVHDLGRVLFQLLDAPAGWRGRGDQADVIARATAPDPADRFPYAPALVTAWRACGDPSPSRRTQS
jgi:hypothetical protein